VVTVESDFGARLEDDLSLETRIGPRGSEGLSRSMQNLFFWEEKNRVFKYAFQFRGFRALKYDVRHTPIVFERMAKERMMKAEVNS